MEHGTVVKWNDDKGFGFIAPKAGGNKLFFHISAFSQHHKRPEKNLTVQYATSQDRRGRPCAVNVAPMKGHKEYSPELSQKIGSVAIFCFFSAVLGLLYFFEKIALEVIWLYGITSVLAFFVYAKDKNAAQSGKWRTKENTLHLLAIAGGWPGAKIAQSFLRHKSKKLSFRITYWVTVCINCGLLYWITTPEGSLWFKALLRNARLG